MIVGGMSCRKLGPMKEDWMLDILEQCEQNSVRFFYKREAAQIKKRLTNLT
ncbi:MAG: DUF5131 family protein [Ginsengibacter sp.]